MAAQISEALEVLSNSTAPFDSHDLNVLPTSEIDCADLIAECAKHDHAAVETAFRERLYDLTASARIIEEVAPQVWQLLDAATILSDVGRCEAGLALWLVEELLDSQTIEGCRHVFDFLESRRERLVSKHFNSKNLIMLRMCNELLRRLSRAEDTVFCGRVFIWLFQSFPLGDKSSVNLRGEFHTENTTTFDSEAKKSEDAVKPMELDVPEGADQAQSRPQTPLSSAPDGPAAQRPLRTAQISSKTVEPKAEAPDLDKLYPIFWSLQSFFSSPTKLFDRTELASFKIGMAATLSVFQKMPSTSSASSTAQRGTKRKLSGTDTPTLVSNTFNPKYLTNRDLFDLEIHDISFRRHILVQALIILDFLLSLTPTAKAKLASLNNNKSVLYTYMLNEEDAKWATSTRATIATYLQQQGNGNEGKFYYRMVDTVLSRDKNWVRWKAEACPPISRNPVDVSTHVEAQNNLRKICKIHPLHPPAGAENLAFLARSEPMEALKDPEHRPRPPNMEELYKGIQNDELDAEMGTEEDIVAAVEAKESKVWRALRAGKRFKLSEEIRNGRNLKALVRGWRRRGRRR